MKELKSLVTWGHRTIRIEPSEGKVSRCISGDRLLDLQLAGLSKEAGLKMTLFFSFNKKFSYSLQSPA